jgi:putative ABC transport system ATP-binding protein
MISLEQLNKSYTSPAGTFPALKNVTLTINQGEFVGVVGKSGSGKSTLLNLIGGIDRPSSGSISVMGKEISHLKETPLAIWRGKTVGFVFQFFQLLPTLTAVENVCLPMDFTRKLAAGQRRSRALALLQQVGLRDHADKLPTALSGGEQQRVAIARALANDPPVILADEPTGNLDSATAQEILKLFTAMAHNGTTVVMVTHEPEVGGLVDRKFELVDGNLVTEKHE